MIFVVELVELGGYAVFSWERVEERLERVTKEREAKCESLHLILHIFEKRGGKDCRGGGSSLAE